MPAYQIRIHSGYLSDLWIPQHPSTKVEFHDKRDKLILKAYVIFHLISHSPTIINEIQMSKG